MFLMNLTNRAGSALISAVVLGSTLTLIGCGSTQTRASVVEDGPDAITGSGAVLTVEGLGCPMCAESISVLLGDVDGVTGSKVNLEDGTVDVSFAPGATVSRAALAGAVNDGGFSYRGMRVKE